VPQRSTPRAGVDAGSVSWGLAVAVGDDAASGSAKGVVLVRLETTSNQAFLATSSKARHLVAASELLHRSTTGWVRDAVADLPGSAVTVVTAVSGVAILLVDSHQAGRGIVRQVTRRALDEAPGMIVHGAVVELASRDGEGLADALGRSARRLVDNRARTADGVRADLMVPLVAPCPTTGRPAAGLLKAADSKDGRGGPVSAFVLRVEQERLRDAAFRRMVDIAVGAATGEDEKGRRLSGMDDLIDRIESRAGDDARWMAVVHADGNGIGAVFIGLSGELRRIDDLGEAVDRFRAVSEAVDRAAQEALRAAVEVVTRGRDEPPAVLPLVCAGDDLTMLVEADIALELTIAYAREFEQRTGEDADIPSKGLTVGAGIAVTKPGHPILFGLELSEALASGAKATGRRARAEDDAANPATIDLHVLQGSGGLGIDDVRPAVVSAGEALPLTAGPWSVARDVADLDAVDDLQRLVGELADPESPARALGQRLRSAAESGREAFDDVVRRSLVRAGGAIGGQPPDGSALGAFARAGCAIHDFGDDARADHHRARVVDALALVGVLTPAQRRTIVAAGGGEGGR
jgi:hypothetical protein